MIGILFQNRYRFDAELGRGGMGMIYRAHDTLLDRDVAVKVLSNSDIGTEGRARLLREAQSAARLNHPNIVSVYDAGEHNGTPFIVMELVSGVSLRDAGTLTIPQIVDLARQLCEALDHAHSHGIIHRDIKPENVLIVCAGEQLAAKLVDFGLARSHTTTRLTQEGALVGTVFYLAPEQALGQALDARADLYSLGVVLYEQVTGRLPFTGDDMLVIIAQHLHAPVTPPSQHRGDVPSALEAVILKLLAKSPDKRFASAREVALALTGAMEPAAPVVPSIPNNLSLPLTSFVGRTREIAEVKQLLSASRLVTLTGAGGCGKTRLALQIAADLLADDLHGVWFVELAPLADPSLVPQAVAKTLSVREEAGRPYLDMLSDYLRAKKSLLVLDNCEHMISACAQLAESLLRTCPDLRILASSREALGISGEVAFRVPSLSLPDTRHSPRAVNLSDFEAVRLFVERAVTALPSFAVTQDNAAAVAQVCHRLDGIPLAIELAAAKIQVLRVEQIAARLDDRFRLLTGGSRTALPRQQTLRAAIDWSYSLLLDDERILLRRLSVFAGGWTLEAAETVCAGERVEGDAILDVLLRLVNKSMAIADRELGQETRYHLLETIRQYAREKLLESGESEHVRHRHFEFFLRLAEQAEPELKGPHQAAWLDRLDVEHDNLRVALDWVLAGQVESGLPFVVALVQFWLRRDYLSEARERLKEAVARTKTAGRTATRARAINGAMQAAFYHGDFASARAHLEESLGIFRELGDAGGIAGSLCWQGLDAWQRNDYAAAHSHFQESLALFEQIGDRWNLANTLHYWGHADLDQNDLESARAHFEESLRLFRELGDIWQSIPLVKDLGLLAYLQEDYAAGRPYYEESLKLARQMASKENIAEVLNMLGDLARCQGDYTQAESLYSDSLALLREMGTTTKTPSTLHNLAYVALHQGDHRKSAALFGESLAIFREQDDKKGVAECLAGIAGVMGIRGKAKQAATLFGAAETARESLGATLWPANRMDHDRNVAAVRSQLDDSTFAAAWDQGRALTLEQAIADAMQTGDP